MKISLIEDHMFMKNKCKHIVTHCHLQQVLDENSPLNCVVVVPTLLDSKGSLATNTKSQVLFDDGTVVRHHFLIFMIWALVQHYLKQCLCSKVFLLFCPHCHKLASSRGRGYFVLLCQFL